MKTIYLQRQGSSYTFNTNNAINSHWGYYVEVETLPGNRYAIRISHTVRETDGKNKTKTINIDARFPLLSDAFRRIEQEFREEYGEDIRIADTIEMYCHNNFTYRKTDDRYLVSCFYEKSTETIRLYPENYCLVSFRHKGTKDYLQMDAATARYLPILEKQAEQHEKEWGWTCHADKSEDFLRERFAWLIGEAIKEQDNERPFYIADTLIK